MALAPISSLKSRFERKSRIQGVQDFENYMHTNPGAAPGGTGKTGLLSNDAQGWSKLLERQQQYLADKAELEGKAGPSVRFGGYSGGVMANSGSNPAMAGLRSVVAPKAAAGGGVMDELIDRYGATGAIRRARQDGLMPQYDDELGREQLATAKHQARRGRMTPADLASEKAESHIRLSPYTNAVDREADYLDDISGSQAASDNYWARGMPIEEDKNRRATSLAMAKGEAATLDDLIRADASKYGADARLSGQRSGQQQQALAALMRIIQGETANARQYGDDNRLAQMVPQLDAMIGGQRTGAPSTAAPAQPRTGAPGAGGFPPAGTPARGANGERLVSNGREWEIVD